VSGAVAGVRAGEMMEGTPYRLLGALGEGGMGEVFEAEHRALGHRVVVKVLHDRLARRADMRDRMRVEAQALARIRHPNLVMVTDFGETKGGRPFLVMERLVGRSLREELVARSALPAAEAAEIARQMLHGLHAAHLAGLVHRDVKPDNVFLCATEDRRPLVKILDFGIVKIVQAGHDPRTPAPPMTPTGDGVLLGTPRFFSPEQARGERDLDARSDIYAVGLVLYVMLAGHGPFDHCTRLDEMFAAQAAGMPLPPSVGASQAIPPALERLVMRALAKPREARFQDAPAFIEEIERFLASVGTDVRALDGPRPVFAGSPAASDFAHAVTSPAFESMGAAGSEDPTATASSVAPGARSEARSAARGLGDGPVVIEGLVQRVLANPPQHVKEGLSRSGRIDSTDLAPLAAPQRTPAGEADDTLTMDDAEAPAPAISASGAAAISASGAQAIPTARGSVPETLPMLQLDVRAAASPAPVAAPPAARALPGAPIAPFASPAAIAVPPAAVPSRPLSPSRPAWRVPAIIAAAVAVLAGAALAAAQLLR
jgi:serine/threonine-protein kinase